jgi:hypothetical protein
VSFVCELILLLSVLCYLIWAVHKFDFWLLPTENLTHGDHRKVTDAVIRDLCFWQNLDVLSARGYYSYCQCQIYSHQLRTKWKYFNENTKLHLQQAVGKMWLFHYSWQVYEVPDDNVTLHLWLPISLGVAAIFTLLMVALWRFDIFNTSNK